MHFSFVEGQKVTINSIATYLTQSLKSHRMYPSLNICIVTHYSLINGSCFRYGSDRSSLYVGLSILVQQIKREGRCDVFTAVRKLRAQRQAMIQSLVTIKNFKPPNIHLMVNILRQCTSSYIEPSPTTWISTRTRTRSTSTAYLWGQCRQMEQLRLGHKMAVAMNNI